MEVETGKLCSGPTKGLLGPSLVKPSAFSLLTIPISPEALARIGIGLGILAASLDTITHRSRGEYVTPNSLASLYSYWL